MIKVIITGDGGQLASELKLSLPSGVDAHFLRVEELDITSKQTVFEIVANIKPDFIINAAAYTAVDKAESDKDSAYAVNETGCENLAEAAKEFGAKLIHVSTDFVFSGEKATPYLPEDKAAPLSVYGASKHAGELKVLNILGAQVCIIRTAWVYSAFGSNFVKTMLRLMTDKEQLGVVGDQIGTPTWAKGLALVIWQLICAHKTQDFTHSILHWTDAGAASWYDFAVAIQELAIDKNIINKTIPIFSITTSDYPTPATRPNFSLMDKSLAEKISNIPTVHWRKQLSAMLDELAITSR